MRGTTFADEIKLMMRYKSGGVVKQIVDVKERNNESSVNRGCNLKVSKILHKGNNSSVGDSIRWNLK